MNKIDQLAGVTVNKTRIEQAETRTVQAEARTEQAETQSEALHASELSYRRLFEAAKDGILILDADTGRINDVNPFLFKLLGFSRSEMVGKTVGELSPFKDIESNKVMLERLQQHGYVRYEDLPLETRDGRHIAVEFISNVYQAGERDVIQCNVRDITERKRIEHQLKDSSKEISDLKSALDEHAIVAITDPQGKITVVNDKFCAISKYSREELLGQDHRLINSRYHPKGFIHEMWATITHGKVWKGEIKNKAKDGSFYWVDATIVPFLNEQGKPRQYVSIRTDITERKQAEEALRESEARYRTLFEYAPDGIVIANSESYYIDANASMCKMLGYTRDELIGLHASNIVAETEIQHIGPALSVIKAKSDYHRDWQFRRKDGSVFAAEVIATTMPDGNLLGMIRDITERRAVKDALDRERNLLRTLIDNLPACIYVKNLEGRYLVFNAASVRQVGLNSEAEAIGKTGFDIFPPEIARLYETDDQQVLVSGQTITDREEPTQDREGNRLCYLTTKLPLRDVSGVIGLLGISQDITERKRTEQALRESEGQFRFLNNLSEATRMLADPAQIMAVMARMLGVHLRASRCAYADVERDGEQFTILHDYTDGCASTVGSYQLSLFGARAVATLHSGQTLIIRNVEAELLPGDGAEMFNAIGIKAIITCPLVKDGGLRAMMAVHQTTPRDWKPAEIAIVQDVVERCWATIERRTAEEKICQLNTELEQRVAERTAQLQTVNEELETFSYSVSHDLRAPLRHIAGFVSLLQEDAGPSLSEQSLRQLTTISKSAKRMGELIDDLLSFSRVGRAELRKTDVNLDELVRGTLGDFEVETKERNIVWKIHPLPPVQADRALLRMVLVNLISNAVKFTGARAEARIEIGCAPDGNGETVIFIRDNGAGFDQKYTAKLFGVFQRLHSEAEFEGTGIGLANVQRIIHRHGGRAWAEGVVDGGATFYFSIPKQTGGSNGN